MKRYLVFLMLSGIGFCAQAQLTEEYSKNKNATYCRPSDTTIVFPIKGSVICTQKYYATKVTTEIEYFIVDATGREVYYEIYVCYGNKVPNNNNADPGYAYYMSMQGNYMAQRSFKSLLVTR